MSLERWLHLLPAALMVALARGLVLFLAAYAVTALVKRLSSEARHLIGRWQKDTWWPEPRSNEAPVWRRTCGTSPGWMRAAAFRKWSAAMWLGIRYSAL